MSVSATLDLLVPPICRLALLAADGRSATWPTVALAAVATDADSEYPTAIRVATQFQPESRVTVRICIGHVGIVPSTWGEVKSFRDLDDRMMIAPAARMMLLSPAKRSENYVF